jgi:alkaline phosphatase
VTTGLPEARASSCRNVALIYWPELKRVLFALLMMPALLTAQGRAKNVVLVLADAGGISTITAASLHATGTPRGLSIQKMPHIVSDSAAGMTAIVAGHKTHNGVIAQGADTVRGKSDGTPSRPSSSTPSSADWPRGSSPTTR